MPKTIRRPTLPKDCQVVVVRCPVAQPGCELRRCDHGPCAVFALVVK